MTEVLPAALVPGEVDLRDFQFTPLYRSRLFGSSFHARSTDAEWRAGMTLWLKSWVPAGTLPDDNIDLCRLAELGRDMKAWTRIRKGAMRGWIKCSDGRLHHPVVAQGVMEAWARRDVAKRKGRAGAAKRWTEQGKDASPTASAAGPPDPSAEAPANTGTVPANIAEALSENSPGIVAAIDETVSDDSNRQGQGQGHSSASLRSADAEASLPVGKPTDESPSALDVKTGLWRDGLAILRSLTRQADGPMRKALGKLLDAAGGDHAALLATIKEAEISAARRGHRVDPRRRPGPRSPIVGDRIGTARPARHPGVDRTPARRRNLAPQRPPRAVNQREHDRNLCRTRRRRCRLTRSVAGQLGCPGQLAARGPPRRRGVA